MKKLHFLVASTVGAIALTATAEQKPERASTDRIRVISADELFDKEIFSSDNREIGDVEYILIRGEDAKVSHVVVERDMQGQKNQFMLVPFAAVKENIEGDRIQIQATQDKLDDAPMLGSKAELATLLEGNKLQEADQFWQQYSAAPMTEEETAKQQQEPQRQGEEQRSTPEKGMEETPEPEKQGGTTGGGMPQDQPEGAQRPEERSSMGGTTPQTGTPETGTPETGTQKPGTPPARMGQQMGEATQAGKAYLLLGDDTSLILHAGAESSQPMEDLNIVSTSNRPIGEIEDVAIDLDKGKVAYTLVGRGGFLGMGASYVAVPMQAIQLTDQQTLQLKIPVGTFMKMRGYGSDDVPNSVLRSELERVYKQFKVQPYWTTKEEVAARAS